MKRFFPLFLGPLRYVGYRPKLIFFVAVVLLLGAMAAGYLYALKQWRGAQEDIKNQHFEQARQKLQFCEQIWPNNVELHLLAARADRLSGRIQSAEEHLQKCLKLHKGASEAIQVEFLLLRTQTGEEDEVAESLIAYVDRGYAESSLILETIARAYMHRYRFGPAFVCLNRWIELEPNLAKPYHWRGWVLERLNKPEAAMADYLHALSLDPNLTDIRLHVGENYLVDNLVVEANSYLEPLHAEFPNRSDITARLGQCRFVQGRIRESQQLLEEALRTMPDDPPLLLTLGKIYLAQDNASAAEPLLRRAIAVDSSDLESHFTLISALQALNRKDDAIAETHKYDEKKALLTKANDMLREEAEHPTDDPNRACEIGSLLLRFGQENQGLYWLDQALIRDPKHAPTHEMFATYFTKRGEPEKAASHRRFVPDR